MNARLPLLAAAVIVSFLAASARGDTHTNLVENFSNYNSVWGATGDASKLVNDVPTETLLADTDTAGWTGTGLVIRARSSVRLGNASKKGTIFTPTISLLPNAKTPGSATLSFHSAKTDKDAGKTLQPYVSVVDENGDDVDGVLPTLFKTGTLVDASSMNNLDTCYTNINGAVLSQTFTGLPNSFRFKFVPSAKNEGRIAIDSVLVTQEVFKPSVISVK